MSAEWERNHLWLYLLALGFDPQTDYRAFELGGKELDKPNHVAFNTLSLFMFDELDHFCAEEDFIDCYLTGCGFTDPKFRKKCSDWLKSLSVQNSFPQMASSSLTYPGGHRITQVLYWFARYVMVKNLKENSVGIDTRFAEAEESSPEDVHMAVARCRIVCNKLLQIFQKEDFVWQEYEQNAQVLIEEIEQMKSEYEALQKQSWNMKHNDENKSHEAERIQKVRSMWTSIMEMLTSLKNQKEGVASVLDELEDPLKQCILDGNVVFRIPELLVHRVESNYCPGNIHEDKKMNFLTVIQLLNEALRALRDENCQSELKELHAIEKMVTICKKTQETLNAKRLEIEQQHRVSASSSVSRSQEDWEVKWKSFLGLHPFDLISDQDLQLGVLRSSPPHSFDLAEERDEDSVFCHHLASASDYSVHEVHYEKDDEALETVMDKSTPSPRLSSVPLQLPEASENREDLHIGTSKGEKKPVSPKAVKNEKDESSTSPACSCVSDHVFQTECSVSKESLLEKARDELAEEIARTVMSDFPQSNEGKVMSLEDLINPISTRKQIPQTTENLLTEMRHSWRKAIQTEVSSDIQLASAEAITEEAPVLETSGKQETAPELTYVVLEESNLEDREKQTLQYVKSSMDPPAVLSENNSTANVLLPDTFQNSLVDGTLFWNASLLLTSFGHEADCLGILDETLPEELDSADFNEITNLQCDVVEMDGACATRTSENKEDIKNSTLNPQSLFSTHRGLKEAAATSEVEMHQTNNEGESVSRGSDGNLAPERREEGEFSSNKVFYLDEEFTKTPSRRSLEKKNSLPSLSVACEYLAEMASAVHQLPLDFMHKLKDKKQLGEQLGTKDPSSE